MIRRVLSSTVLLTAFSVVSATAAASGISTPNGTYPNRPVSVIVPYPAGGPTDSVARLVFQKVSERLGQQFVIENKGGAGGNIGAVSAARASADGYTLFVAAPAHTINMTLFSDPGYDINADFEAITQLANGPLLLFANSSFPVNSAQELIDKAKSEPQPLQYATSGNGQSSHLTAELFKTAAGINLEHIPYKGSAPALADIVAGHVSLGVDSLLSALPHVQSGKLRALAVTSPNRSDALPDVPTMQEVGLKDFESTVWYGVLAPKGTDPSIVTGLNKELKAVLEMSEVKEALRQTGFSTGWSSPEDFAKFIKDETEKWEAAVKVSGAKIS